MPGDMPRTAAGVTGVGVGVPPGVGVGVAVGVAVGIGVGVAVGVGVVEGDGVGLDVGKIGKAVAPVAKVTVAAG